MLIPLCRAPRVWLADDFVSLDECEHILASAADAERLAAAGVTTRHDHSGFWFELPIADDVVAGAIARRTCDALGLENDFGTTLRFRRVERVCVLSFGVVNVQAFRRFSHNEAGDSGAWKHECLQSKVGFAYFFSSTRRFFARPSGVLLSPTGWISP